MGRVLLALFLLNRGAGTPACRLDTRVEALSHESAQEPGRVPARQTRVSAPRAAKDLRELAREVFLAINEQRRAHGLTSLEWDDKLAEQARSHSARMAARAQLSHDDPERGNVAARLKRARIAWHACAENLFEERGFADPVEAAVDGWMKSEGHRHNVLRPELRRTGVGIATRSNGTLYFTQIFIVP